MGVGEFVTEGRGVPVGKAESLHESEVQAPSFKPKEVQDWPAPNWASESLQISQLSPVHQWHRLLSVKIGVGVLVEITGPPTVGVGEGMGERVGVSVGRTGPPLLGVGVGEGVGVFVGIGVLVGWFGTGVLVGVEELTGGGTGVLVGLHPSEMRSCCSPWHSFPSPLGL